MIKKLRKKFILTAMLAVFIVLFAIMATINLTNYINLVNDADHLLNIISDNNGSFPGTGKDPLLHHDKFDNITMSPETPYETRFFTVTLAPDGTVTDSSTDNIAAVDATSAAQYAADVAARCNSSGFIDEYRYKVTDVDGGKLYIFTDCSRSLISFRRNLFTTLLVSAFGLACVFGLVVSFSRIALSPVEQSFEKQKSFITDASHELKTPLTIIDANTEVIELENGETEWTQSIKKQVSRLSELIGDMITLSRLDESGAKISMTDFSLSDAVTETLDGYTSGDKHINTKIQPNISMKGNEKLIRQLVGILGENALKYADSGTDVDVSLRATSKNAELKFRNRASGIGQGSHDVFFERFYRADSSRNSETSGYGIGLSVARSIVDNHSGKITAYSPDGDTVEFTAVLPL